MLMIVSVRISAVVEFAVVAARASVEGAGERRGDEGTLIAVTTTKSMTADAMRRGQRRHEREPGISATPPHCERKRALRYFEPSSSARRAEDESSTRMRESWRCLNRWPARLAAGSARSLAEIYRHFGETDVGDNSPLYRRVAVAIGDVRRERVARHRDGAAAQASPDGHPGGTARPGAARPRADAGRRATPPATSTPPRAAAIDVAAAR